MEWDERDVSGDLRLRIEVSSDSIRLIGFHLGRHPSGIRNPENRLIAETARQLQAYFAGTLRVFDLPLEPHGTEFQLRVWHELLRIPFGETRSYSQIAAAIGSPAAIRAVGAANGANPIAIVVPCHRVIGSSGKLTGYGGGLSLKQRLLELEGCATPRLPFASGRAS